MQKVTGGYTDTQKKHRISLMESRTNQNLYIICIYIQYSKFPVKSHMALHVPQALIEFATFQQQDVDSINKTI